MKDYFKRLKEHPGIEWGIMFPVLGFFAGATNKSAEWYIGGSFGCIAMAIVVWSIILISNRKTK